MKRKIVKIDGAKCTGCGQCASACAEGAIQIVNGKARLISESCCDGLGACLGECPEDAITIEEREADEFDPSDPESHVRPEGSVSEGSGRTGEKAVEAAHRSPATHEPAPHVCPGTAMRELKPRRAPGTESAVPAGESELRHWPIQLKLVAPNAPFLKDADLLLAADCVPFAMADFHPKFLHGRSVIIGCPKLDDPAFYVEKLTEIFKRSGIKSVTVLHMEVPCCFGLKRIAEAALEASDNKIPMRDVTVSVAGKVIETR
jgi:NAD-dependent dihydropyrimidine dehydrogenase PreA subunit